jgi:hypothetical protein
LEGCRSTIELHPRWARAVIMRIAADGKRAVCILAKH